MFMNTDEQELADHNIDQGENDTSETSCTDIDSSTLENSQIDSKNENHPQESEGENKDMKSSGAICNQEMGSRGEKGIYVNQNTANVNNSETCNCDDQINNKNENHAKESEGENKDMKSSGAICNQEMGSRGEKGIYVNQNTANVNNSETCNCDDQINNKNENHAKESEGENKDMKSSGAICNQEMGSRGEKGIYVNQNIANVNNSETCNCDDQINNKNENHAKESEGENKDMKSSGAICNQEMGSRDEEGIYLNQNTANNNNPQASNCDDKINNKKSGNHPKQSEGKNKDMKSSGAILSEKMGGRDEEGIHINQNTANDNNPEASNCNDKINSKKSENHPKQSEGKNKDMKSSGAILSEKMGSRDKEGIYIDQNTANDNNPEASNCDDKINNKKSENHPKQSEGKDKDMKSSGAILSEKMGSRDEEGRYINQNTANDKKPETVNCDEADSNNGMKKHTSDKKIRNGTDFTLQVFRVQQRRLLKNLMIMIAAFLICFTPACIMIYYINFCKGFSCNCVVHHWLRDLQFVVTAVNSAINPFIYTWRLPKFRKGLFVVLGVRSKRSPLGNLQPSGRISQNGRLH